MILKFFQTPNNNQYGKYYTGWKRGRLVGAKKGPKYYLKNIYTNNMHRVFGVLHMYHVLALGIISYDNA